MEPSSDDLIGRWVAGEARAAEELYRLYFARVRGFAQKLGAPLADAEDIAQEALIAGLDGIKGGKRPDHFTQWLLGIAKHFTYRNPRAERSPTDVADPSRRGAGTVVVRREMRELLQRSLRGLPARHRKILDLLHQRDLSRKEVADKLDIPVEALHARCERIYARLREDLSRHFTTLALAPLAPRSVSLSEIRALRPAFREAVIARHLEDLSESEAAARVGVPVATLRARLESAYEMLKCDRTADFSTARAEYRRQGK